MNAILTADFKLPEDGVYHLAPEGEFLHKKTGLRQVLDAEACAAIVADFTTRAAEPGFPGVLVDYDHESLDMDKRTEAAGWLLSLEHRPGSGLWGRIRWTDTGDAAIRGGRYRFISPVWKQEDCEDLGEMRLRPRRLMNAAITNAPNMAGAAPLSNSCPASSASPCESSPRQRPPARQRAPAPRAPAAPSRNRGTPSWPPSASRRTSARDRRTRARR